VTGLFSTRGYNIESLSVAATDDPSVSRVTLVTKGADGVILQIVNQLNKLVDVVAVEDLTRGEHIERELVVLKLRVEPQLIDSVRGYVVRAGGRVLAPSPESFVVEAHGLGSRGQPVRHGPGRTHRDRRSRALGCTGRRPQRPRTARSQVIPFRPAACGSPLARKSLIRLTTIDIVDNRLRPGVYYYTSSSEARMADTTSISPTAKPTSCRFCGTTALRWSAK
jgi:acetolactate synthase-1/3 small subunit